MTAPCSSLRLKVNLLNGGAWTTGEGRPSSSTGTGDRYHEQTGELEILVILDLAFSVRLV